MRFDLTVDQSLITRINGSDSMSWGRVQLEFELTYFGYTIFFYFIPFLFFFNNIIILDLFFIFAENF